MKTSKKLVALLLVFVVCASALVACGSKSTSTTTTNTAATTTNTAAATTTTNNTAAATTTTNTAAAGNTVTSNMVENVTPEIVKLAGTSPIKFAVTLQNTSNPFFTEIKVGLQEAIDALGNGSTLDVYDANTDINKQVSDMEDAINKGINVLFVNSVDSTGVNPAIEEAHKAGVICIAIDTPLDDPSLLATTVASDNYQAGVLCADNLAAALGEKGNLGAYLRSTSKVAKLRGDGFSETIAKSYPNMKIVNAQEGTAGSADAALPCMEAILQANPDITGQFALNDPSAQGCISAIEAANKLSQIKVVGIDGSKEAKALIKEGKQLGSSAQFPGKMGTLAVIAAVQSLAGQKLQEHTYIQTIWCNKDNCDTMKNYDYDN